MLAKKIFCTISSISIILCNQAWSSNYKPDDHAPIGVMRDHVHQQGEFMTSYRSGVIKMKGLMNGTDKVSSGEALNHFMMVPANMTMKMHMVGIMYGVTYNLTLSGMSGIVEKEMNMLNKMAVRSKRETLGISDSNINASYQIFKDSKSRLQINFGISLPTGSTNKNYQGSRQAYGMQIGSGSYELNPGISYTNYYNNFSYGAQINGNFKINSNKNGYKFGDRYNLTAWFAKNLNQNFSISSRLNYDKIEAIEGKDPTLTGMTPSIQAGLYDKERLDLLFGINYLLPDDLAQGNRLGIEFGMPIFERIDGPMLKKHYQLMLGWQKAF